MLCFVWLGASSPASASCEDDPRDCFRFDDDGSIITESGKAERTFSFPPLKAGFVVDFYNRDILPHISIEIKTFEIPHAGDFAFDAGVATSRVFASLTWEFLPIVKIGPCIWAGYNVKENDPAFGVGVSMLDF
jgi:hypothetical protein